MAGWLKRLGQGLTNMIPIVGPALGTLWEHSRVGYETSPGKRAWDDAVRNEQSIFNRDSLYNSPAEQMKRMKEAGLNPNLMYGQGTVGNTSGQAMSSANANPRGDVMAQMLQALMMKKEIELKDAQIESTRADARLKDSRIGSEDQKQQRMQQDFEYLRERYPQLIEQLRRENYVGAKTAQDRITKVSGDAIMIMHQIRSELMRQGLMEKDGHIKEEVLQGKRLSNSLLQIQEKFLKEGVTGPAQLWQMLMMVLSRAL